MKPLMTELVSGVSKNSKFEMDPTRIDPRENMEENMQTLISISQRFVDCIIKNVEAIPKDVRRICAHISAVVGEKYPDSRLTAVGGFGIFSRSLTYSFPEVLLPCAGNSRVLWIGGQGCDHF